MKKSVQFILSLFLLLVLNSEASNRYWVGGSGEWNSPAHWALKSGGKGGAQLPTAEDNVFIDSHSFTAPAQVIKIRENAMCANFNWTATNAILAGSVESNLSVYGSFYIPENFINNFKGKLKFLSSSFENKITTSGKIIAGDIIFDGPGSWILSGALQTAESVTIYLLQGSLNTNGKNVNCGSFIGTGAKGRVLDITNSVVTVENNWDLSQPKNLEFIYKGSELKMKKGLSTNFKSGRLGYGKITNLSKMPVAFTVQIEKNPILASNKCSGDTMAALVVRVQGGTPPYVYTWGTSPLPTTHTSSNPTDTIRNLGQQTITVLVEDSSFPKESGSDSYSITAPSALIVNINTNNVTCFGACDAFLKPVVAGGTGLITTHTYNWTPGGITPYPATLTGICANIPYKLTITDANGCIGVANKTAIEYPALQATIDSTNVKCKGAPCDGTLTAIPTGGNPITPPATVRYTHSWSNGLHTATISNLCAGVYYDTIRDSRGCTLIKSARITEPELLTLAIDSTTKNVSCGGLCDGRATVKLKGGTSPYKYEWSTGSTTTTASTTNTIISLCAGSYTVKVTDNNGCLDTLKMVITEPVPLTVLSKTRIPITCNGSCNGSATINVTGGSTPYTYLWGPGNPTGGNTNTISNLCPDTTYTFAVRDANNCILTDTVAIHEPDALVANPTKTDVSCFGERDGTATAVVQGGTQPYTYRWLPILPPATASTIDSLGPGTYRLVVTDINNCKDTSAPLIITEPGVLNVATAISSEVTCNDSCNGSITASPTGGNPPYTYSWIPSGQTTKTAMGLCAGNHTVTITDANGCTITKSTNLIAPPLLGVTFPTIKNASCNGKCDGSLSSTVTGGTPSYTYSWSSGETTPSISGKCANTYTLTVTDARGCTSSNTQTISQPSAMTFIPAIVTPISCFGSCTGEITVLAVGGGGGITYSWIPGSQNTNKITGLCEGDYRVVATDVNNCSISDTFLLTAPLPLTETFSNVTDVSCTGGCNGSATSVVTGGTPPYSYSWPLPITTTGPTAINLCANTYEVIVTDFNNCEVKRDVTIGQPTPVSATISGSTSSCNICNGTATATATGGTAPYTYSWAPGGQTTVTATGLCPNTIYTVTITDAKGCTATASVTIQQTIIITITASSSTLSCTGACDGVATANATGGKEPYNFVWAGPGGPYTSQTVSGLCAGSYTVTVSDAAGCYNTDIVKFTDPPVLTLSTSQTNVTCAAMCNGTGTGIPSGGTGPRTYHWMPGGQTTQTAIGLCSGSYTLTVKDSMGCTATSSITITEPTAIVDHVSSTAANCTKADGTITVAPTGGVGPYTYDWNGSSTPTGDGTPKIINLLAGVYTVAIRDNTGCIVNFSYLLNNIAGPTLTVPHTNVSCHDACDGSASVTVTGGKPPYTYLWNPGGFTTTSLSALCGTIIYTVRVQDSVQCITFDTATVINPPALQLNPAIVKESCGGSCNASITLNPTGGKFPYTYLWNNGSISSAITNLCAGSYTVIVKDANNCSITDTLTIASPPALSVSLDSTNVKCKAACNGTATAKAIGGTGAYTYSWTNQPASVVLPAIVNLCPNQYIVTVKDGNGCTAKDTVNITEPPALISSTIKKDISCHGKNNGLAVVTASGGVAPYTYVWNPGPIFNDTASALYPGRYNATVIDANGCSGPSPSVTITQPAVIVPQLSVTNPLCNASCNGTAAVSPTGGTGTTYTYSWTPGGFTTKNISNICAGTYTVTVRDSLGCSVSENKTLINPSILNANTGSASPSCVDGCNGSATANPVGGTAGYTYSWSPVISTNQTASNLCPGSYTVIVTDANNCKDTQQVQVTNPLPVNVGISTSPSTCNACDGTISINPISGKSPFTYVWTGGLPPSATQVNVCPGIYTVNVTDSLGCDSTFTIVINNSNGPTGETVVTTPVVCNKECNGSGTVTPIGGTPPYVYLWNNLPTPATTNTATNLCADKYFVQVKDNNSCLHYSPVVITQPAPIVSHATITNAACSGICTGKITVAPTGGTGKNKYTYLWAPGGQTTPAVTSLCPGTYTLTITDSSLCTQVDSFLVGQSSPLAATVTAVPVSCSSLCNGKAYIHITNGTPPYTVQWNDPMAQTTDTARSLCAGNYTVDIRDALGCHISLTVTVTATTAIVSSPAIINAACGACDGQATLTTTGGSAPYQYLWSNGQTVETATMLCAGLYTVNVKDALGCATDILIPINNTNGPTSATIASSNVTCNGLCNGAVTGITPVGGVAPYQYSWIQSGQTTAALSNLCAGIYYVKITDSTGCSLVDSVTITSPAPLLANQKIKTPSCGICDGEIAIAPSGGTAPYTILWNTGSTGAVITNLCADLYTVQISDANCIQLIDIPLNTSKGPSLMATSTDIACNDSCTGTALVTPTSGVAPYTTLWSNGLTTPALSNLCPGIYIAQVKGADGCASSTSVAIQQQSTVKIDLGNVSDPLCNGDANGTITVIPTGGTLPYTYNWTPAVGTGATINSLPANTYTIMVTDANGCQASRSVTLTSPSPLTIIHTTTNASCNTIADGTINVTTAGGTLPYVFQWSGGSTATTEDLTNVLSGSYTITVTDLHGCRINDSITVQPNQFVTVGIGNDTTFCEASSFTLSAANNTNAVNYKWFQLPANTIIGTSAVVTVIPPLGSTNYYVVVDNGTGCSSSDTIELTSNPLPGADAGKDKNVYAGNSTTIGGTPTTTSVGATIAWMPATGLNNPLISNPVSTPVSTTTYVVSVTSIQGCVSTDSMVVTLIPTIDIPSGITPNGDGANDVWKLSGIEIFPDCMVELYNRWGERVFQSPGYQVKWDGTYKGKALPVGTYYYIIDLHDPSIPVYTGTVTILR